VNSDTSESTALHCGMIPHSDQIAHEHFDAFSSITDELGFRTFTTGFD
jgi:hypothetical protein